MSHCPSFIVLPIKSTLRPSATVLSFIIIILPFTDFHSSLVFPLLSFLYCPSFALLILSLSISTFLCFTAFSSCVLPLLSFFCGLPVPVHPLSYFPNDLDNVTVDHSSSEIYTTAAHPHQQIPSPVNTLTTRHPHHPTPSVMSQHHAWTPSARLGGVTCIKQA